MITYFTHYSACYFSERCLSVFAMLNGPVLLQMWAIGISVLVIIVIIIIGEFSPYSQMFACAGAKGEG